MTVHSLFAILSTMSVIAVADRVPSYNFEPSCRAAVDQMPARLETCIKSEQDARAKLASEWTQYPLADRTACVGASSAGGSPSYVELLVCLGMKEQVRDIRRKNPE